MSSDRTDEISQGRRLVPALFTLTIFLSAMLLFFVQPLFAKIVLPQIGGAPAVWTTAMLFFQSVLIAGYLYAHVLTNWLPQRAQLAVHLTFWAAALLFLPLGIPDGWQFDPARPPALQTLLLFAAGVGVPFAMLSANAPLIQAWYARSGGPSAHDPYFLYGASNTGSLLALLAFPLVAEPLFGARQIGIGWAAGVVLLGLLLLLSGLAARGIAMNASPQAAAPRPSAGRVAYWLLLAFVPSSLMLGVTTEISTDLGAVPLIWVVPLALYLLTFVLNFSRRRIVTARRLRWPALVALAGLLLLKSGFIGEFLTVGGAAATILAFFVVALFAHALLYESRPEGVRLTQFYLVMSVGGALGGLFNSIIAPVAFDWLLETRITVLIALALLLGTWFTGDARRIWQAAGFAAAGVALVLIASAMGLTDPSMLTVFLMLYAAAVAFPLRKNLIAAALAVGPVALVASAQMPDGTILRDRSFFGTHSVRDTDGLRRYSNGTTLHGAERLSDLATGAPPRPLYYYHPNGPLAEVLNSTIGTAAESVGIVGLGVGSLACYRKPGQRMAFYEIDPLVDRIARNPALFTFLHSCAADAPTYLGDARIVLEQQEQLSYDILVIDAYSSDAVPVHLTTLEAIELYIDRLAPGGVLLFHISNRYYQIDRLLGRAAAAMGLAARLKIHRRESDEVGDTMTTAAVLARSEADLGALSGDTGWVPMEDDGGPYWTDDHANILSILRLRQSAETP